MNWDPYLYHVQEITRPAFKNQTIKLLEENVCRSLFDGNHSKILFDPPPIIMEMKIKINKWDLIKLKIFCTAKKTINKMKGQPSE